MSILDELRGALAYYWRYPSVDTARSIPGDAKAVLEIVDRFEEKHPGMGQATLDILLAELSHEEESNHISIEQWGIWEARAKAAEAERDRWLSLLKFTVCYDCDPSGDPALCEDCWQEWVAKAEKAKMTYEKGSNNG